MNKRLLFLLIIPLYIFGCTGSHERLKSHLQGLMNEQSNSWNQGDIEGFMKHYWNSDSLMFIGGNGPQYGWQNTLERYRKAYPDKATMGELQFEMLRFESFPKDAALISGKWYLKRDKGDVGGYYSLLWKKIDDRWKIIYDHTSSVKLE
jgi:ketosteroid isomerase-like protein